MHRNGNKIFFIMLALVAAGLLYLLAPILTPFLAGALLAYLLNPIVNALQRFHLPRVLSVAILFLFLFVSFVVLILLLIPIVESQVESLVYSIPDMVAWVENKAAPWIKMGNHKEIVDVASLKAMITANATKAGGAADWIFSAILLSGVKIAEWIINLVLIPVVTFYLLCDWRKLLQGFDSLLPRPIEPTFAKLMGECDAVLSEFFRGQLIVILILSVLYSIALTLVGLQIGVVVGVIAGLMSIVPYLGFVVGIVIAGIASYVQTGSLFSLFLVCMVFLIGHLIENMFLSPYFIGKRVGLHPVAVIFAVLAGGCLFGFLGVLLALPAASVIMVWLRYLHKRYRKSDLYRAT
ncbi:MAG: AI-2E family transporter [Gammaproteobacteria bacterium]|nr:AI-2E family transporter [Gammaproteobacteria bacterium]